MKTLLVCATEKEIKPLLKTGFREKGNVDLLITCPGIPSTVYYLTKLLCKKKYDLVINAGICGSFNKNYRLGDVVNVVEDCFSDLGAEDDNRFIHISEMNLQGNDAFPLRKKIVASKAKIKSKTLATLKKVRGITVNTVHGNAKSINKVKKLFNPDVETMEGAALFYTCFNFGIPFIQIRAISNYVEKRDKSKWKTDEAINNLCSVVEIFLEEVTLFRNFNS